MLKVIIAGGRDFDDYNLLRDKCDVILSRYLKFDYKKYDKNPYLEIVSGKARGADALGETYAIHNLIPIKPFPANWDKHGKSAGYIRNKQMAEYADALIAFHDGVSKGTGNMIELANKHKLKTRIINYE